MRYIDMHIKMKSDEAIKLNKWLGSTLKGAIVASLKKQYCNEKDFVCDNCKMSLMCPIQALFNEKNIQLKSNTCNPIIINTFINDEVFTDEFYINIKLIEHGIMYKDTLEDILRKGIWIISEGDRMKFQSTGIIYTGKNGEKQLDAEVINNDNVLENVNITNTLIIYLESPLRVQSSAIKLDFNDLIRIMMTRLDSINVLENKERCYSKDLIEKSKSIKTITRDINIENITRKSSHTKTKTCIDCLVGKIIYQGDFTDYAEIIKKSELVNIGKWTTFGLGRIRAEFI